MSFDHVDIFSDEVLNDPYTTFAAMREAAPAVWLPANNVWALTRFKDIRAALLNWQSFSSNKVAFNDDMNNALTGTTLATDPPDHQPLRSALMENLTPRSLKSMKDDIDAKADEIVGRLAARGSFDAITDIARELPLQVVADLIGVQGEARSNILRWGEAAFNVLGPINQRTIQSFPVAGELFGWAVGVQAEDLAEGSLGRAIFAAAERGQIPRESCGPIIHQYVAAGMDSTIASIGNALWLLGRHPDQYQLLREEPSLIPSAFNETLRFEPAIHSFGRLLKDDFVIDDITIPGGSQVAVLYLAGNRDPRHYENPESFDVRRNPADHLSFGAGVHSCAGQGLARLEGHAAIEAVVRHIKSFTIGAPVRKLNNSSRGLESLAITAQPVK